MNFVIRDNNTNFCYRNAVILDSFEELNFPILLYAKFKHGLLFYLGSNNINPFGILGYLANKNKTKPQLLLIDKNSIGGKYKKGIFNC